MAYCFTPMIVVILVFIPLECSSRSLPNNEAPLPLPPTTVKSKQKKTVSNTFINSIRNSLHLIEGPIVVRYTPIAHSSSYPPPPFRLPSAVRCECFLNPVATKPKPTIWYTSFLIHISFCFISVCFG